MSPVWVSVDGEGLEDGVGGVLGLAVVQVWLCTVLTLLESGGGAGDALGVGWLQTGADAAADIVGFGQPPLQASTASPSSRPLLPGPEAGITTAHAPLSLDGGGSGERRASLALCGIAFIVVAIAAMMEI